VKYILGNKEFDKVKGEMEMVGNLNKFPENLLRSLFLADVRLNWDSVNKSWVSRADRDWLYFKIPGQPVREWYH